MPKTNTSDWQEYSIAGSTRKLYAKYLKLFDAWRKDREINDACLAEYLIHMFETGKAPGTAAVHTSAIRWRETAEDKPDPRGKRTRAALKNFKREAYARGNGQADGITFEMRDTLVSIAAQEGTLDGYQAAALFPVMSFAMLRVGEAIAADVDHVDFAATTLYIPRSKTDQTGKGTHLYLGPKTIEHVKRWLEKAKIKEGPLFRPRHNYFHNRVVKGRLQPKTIRQIIKERCAAAGFKGRFSGHSFRVGSAQSLAVWGVSLVEMQRAGRWKDPGLPARYAEKVAAQQSAMARFQ